MKAIFSTVAKTVGPKLGNAALALKKASPEILLGAGIVGFVGTNILTARSSTKFEAELLHLEDEIEWIKAEFDVEKDSKFDHNKNMTKTYAMFSLRVIKLYAPSLILGSLSIAALLGSNKILRDRNVAIMAAYQTMSVAYSKYRERVREEFGEDTDFRLANFLKKETTKEVEKEDGSIKEEKVVEYKPIIKGASPYARFFDEFSTQWQKQDMYNQTFLAHQESYFNDRLIAHGHVFLNEVYDALGLPRSKAGQVVGWKLNNGGDNHISFGIYDLHDPAKRMFVNGHERSILLDFNVDGVIYDKIEEE